MNIPFVDLQAQYLSIQKEIDGAIQSVIQESAFIGGTYVTNFETAFAQTIESKHCISCANGTDSLFIILKMLEIGAGDEVITVANSWISSSETISLTGAKPVFVDVDSNYFSINEHAIEQVITPKTKAIIVVHLHGQPCEMDTIMAIANKHNIWVIEDCAQAHLTTYQHKKVGNFGIAASFSFYPGKNLGAYGDAGCIITNNDDLAIKCKMFARHGALKKHEHIIEGINSRMDGLQAAILLAKLPHLQKWTQQRIENANYYHQILNKIPEISVPIVRKNAEHSFHLYVIKCQNRNALAAFLKENGIETAIHYPTPLPELQAYKYLNYVAEDFPVAHQLKTEILSLPMFPELSHKQMDYIAERIRNFYKHHITV